MDMRDLYDNPEDSDVTIKLRDGSSIYAHRVVLKKGSELFRRLLRSRMKESNGTIEFPDHADSVVRCMIQRIYGTHPCAMPPHDWFSLLRFANYLCADAIVEEMVDNIHPCATVPDLLAASFELDKPALLSRALRLFVRKYSEPAATEFASALVGLGRRSFDAFHRQWLVEKLDQFILFQLDCAYCDMTNDANLLIELILHFDFEKFDSTQLLAAIETPIITRTPHVAHLLTCILRGGTAMSRRKRRTAARTKNITN